MDYYLITDAETNGIPDFKLPADHPTQPRIASLAGILCNQADFSVLGTYFGYVINDGWTMPQGTGSAGEINGITDAFLQAVGFPIQNVMEAFADFLSLGVTLVGFGVEFDHKMIRGELRRLQMDDYYNRTQVLDVMRKNVGVCKLPQNRPGRGGYKTPTLVECYQHWFKKTPEGAHNCYADCLHTLRILKAMRAAGIDLTPKEPKKEGDATMAPRPAPREGAAGSASTPAASSPQPAAHPSSPSAPAGAPASVEETSFI